MTLNRLRQRLENSLEQYGARYVEVSKAIFSQPETGNNEYFASQQLTQLLEAQGFTVTRNVAGHETAFYAVKRH